MALIHVKAPLPAVVGRFGRHGFPVVMAVPPLDPRINPAIRRGTVLAGLIPGQARDAHDVGRLRMIGKELPRGDCIVHYFAT
jgi:hypothetical protein